MLLYVDWPPIVDPLAGFCFCLTYKVPFPLQTLRRSLAGSRLTLTFLFLEPELSPRAVSHSCPGLRKYLPLPRSKDVTCCCLSPFPVSCRLSAKARVPPLLSCSVVSPTLLHFSGGLAVFHGLASVFCVRGPVGAALAWLMGLLIQWPFPGHFPVENTVLGGVVGIRSRQEASLSRESADWPPWSPGS